MIGAVIDRLLVRRYGAPLSDKWWARSHEHEHRRMVTFDCPYCPNPAALAERVRTGAPPPAMSYNDAVRLDAALREFPR